MVNKLTTGIFNCNGIIQWQFENHKNKKVKKLLVWRAPPPIPQRNLRTEVFIFWRKKVFYISLLPFFVQKKSPDPDPPSIYRNVFFLFQGWGGEGSMGVTSLCYYPHRCRSAMNPWRCLAMFSRRWNTYIPCDMQPHLPLSYATHTYLRHSLLI